MWVCSGPIRISDIIIVLTDSIMEWALSFIITSFDLFRLGPDGT